MTFKENVYGCTMHNGQRCGSGELKREKNSPKRLSAAPSRIREGQIDTCMLCKPEKASLTLSNFS